MALSNGGEGKVSSPEITGASLAGLADVRAPERKCTPRYAPDLIQSHVLADSTLLVAEALALP